MEQLLTGLLTADNMMALVTLTALEIVLGIDNVIFIAILVGRLPESQRDRARMVGLFLAMFMRIALLFAITAVMWLEKFSLFTLPWAAHDEAVAAGAAVLRGNVFTGKDLVLALGGGFLIFKSVYEIHHKIEDAGLEGRHEVSATPKELGNTGAVAGGYVGSNKKSGFAGAIVQLLLLDLVFSLDSVITAVGMAKHLGVMVAAVVIAVGVMMVFSGAIARFVDKHPTIKMLALSFLILIGVMLVADGTGWHMPKGYIYFAMAFALGVEMLNIWVRGRAIRKAQRAKA